MTAKTALIGFVILLLTACSETPVTPTTGVPITFTQEELIGQMAVAFLNRFVASNVPPAACLVDFTDACRGKRDEMGDIEYNRAHYQIVGARLGQPVVRLAGSGASADIAVPCAFDSRVTKCEGAGCVLGAFEHVAGTCNLTSVRETSRWALCTSTFSGSAALSPSFQAFFGVHSN